MLPFVVDLCLLLFAASALPIVAYATAQLHLLSIALRSPGPPIHEHDDRPTVTVQLPLFNERDVVERLLRAIANLDWPADRLQIQVLDDSTDETSEIVARLAEELGLDHVQRPTRDGFKAGALAHGMHTATGELIAIFDADFVPGPSFLHDAYARMAPDTGLVQARWGWLNRDANLLTSALALHLDAHFAVEQHARWASGLLVGFNGTAGLWRRRAIEDAGGWSADTLTEDLDLSYRAQLTGWRVVYADDIVAPSELPTTFGAICTQQHRWMKGGAQVARKLLPTVWRAQLPLTTRLQATAHLLGSTLFIGVVILLLVGPLFILGGHLAHTVPLAIASAAGALLPLSVATLACLYATAASRRGHPPEALARVVRIFPVLLSLSAGMSWRFAHAVAEAWRGLQSPFVRTPKAGDQSTSTYASGSTPHTGAGEAALAAWTCVGIALAATSANWVGVLFHALPAAGCATVAVAGWRATR